VLTGGKAVVRDLDVVTAAGAPLTAVTRSFAVTVVGGVLDLEFKPSLGQAIVSSVEVVRK
jgi:beta-galactosidase